MTVDGLDDMLSALADPTGSPKEEPKDAPKEEINDEVLDPEQEPEGEPVVDPEPEPEPEPEEDEKDKTIAELRAKLAEKETQKEEPKPEPEIEITDQNFLESEEEFDEVLRDKDALNKLLNRIYKQASLSTQKAIEARIGKTIPELVKSNISVVQEMQKTSEQFYVDNEDLKQFPKVVSTVFAEIAKAKPDAKLEDVLKDVATETRKRLDLPSKGSEKKKAAPPKLPQKSGRVARPAEEKPEPLQDELDAMNKVIRS